MDKPYFCAACSLYNHGAFPELYCPIAHNGHEKNCACVKQ